MSNEDTAHEAPTRRDYVKYGGTVVGGGLLAGCTGDGGGDSPETDTSTEGSTNEETENPEDASYSVNMSPVGTVEFKEPPQSIFTVLVHHADMALALGYGDAINAMYSPTEFDSRYRLFLDRLDGVSIDWSDLDNAWNIGKERLYDLDSDIHLTDPAYVVAQMDNWDVADTEEVRENIAPWFGNTLSGEHSQAPSPWTDDYQYYTLWEIFEKVSKVFQEERRYQVLTEIHSNLVSTIQSNLPPEVERPRTAYLNIARTGIQDGIWAYSLNQPGFFRASTRPLRANDAFPDLKQFQRIDREALVAADPDVILRTGSMGEGRNWAEIKNELKNDPVTQEILAVQNDRIHPLAVQYGGPILNLFQLEMAAKELYPERFGQWPSYDGGRYPDFSPEEQLFDHQRVADIINGDI
ncbi:ABC transporter substrate-binding protein [Halorubrum sp. DM2]|uniref:ABC transporter substrate-binding protein n=1 Tax=Halorubrum sp. DM2 TaxID=2527867 RepID=UPI0024B85AE3|nr:ABC transporter substrate-binding protein [Halorubrum sp. DM2]